MDQLQRELRLPGKIIVSWALSGAILAGGILVAYALFYELIAHYALIPLIIGLYFTGGIIAFLLGGALGMFGRPIEMNVSEAFADQISGVLYSMVLGVVGIVVAGWIALTYAALYYGNILAIVIACVSWGIAFITISFAIHYGYFGFSNLGERAKSLFRIPKFKLKIEFVRD